MTSQEIVLNFGRVKEADFKKLQDRLWNNLKTFNLFNGNKAHPNIATARLIKPSDVLVLLRPELKGSSYVEFKTTDELKRKAQGASSGDGPDHEVYVRLFADEEKRVVRAVTLGNHMIVGVREWKFRAFTATAGSNNISGGDMVISITTTAWEQRNCGLTDWGFWTLGSEDMKTVWVSYLSSLARDLQGQVKDTVRTWFNDFPMRKLEETTPNPFSRLIPDPNFRQPSK